MKIKIIQVYVSKQQHEQVQIDNQINAFIEEVSPEEILNTKVEVCKIPSPREELLDESAIFITVIYK